MMRYRIIIFFLLFTLSCTESSLSETEADAEDVPNELLVADTATLDVSQLENVAEATAVSQPTLMPPPPSPTAETQPTDEPIEEPTPPLVIDIVEEPEVSQPRLETIPFTAVDGLEIQSTYAVPGGEAPFPGILLLHMLGGNREVWTRTGLIDTLRLNGYAVLAIDMRGHGATGGSTDWTVARQDLAAIYEQFVQFSEIDPTKTAVIGGSIGANLALALAVDKSEINTAILLSPGLDYRGVITGDLAPAYGDRPLFIAASQEDGYAASSSESLIKLAANGTMQLYNGVGHGTAMLSNEPALTALILEWLGEGIREP